ncbi:unnamed protein product [marine sediment metagenome]|uniref:Uncharacterized protein n=1 Tax=marine sediment metagenome TaxID=412755 RepID=X0UD50_9ZZZZ
MLHNLHFNGIEIFSLGHSEQAVSLTSNFPKLANIPLLPAVCICPAILALILNNEAAPIPELADEIGVESVGGSLEPEGSIGSTLDIANPVFNFVKRIDKAGAFELLPLGLQVEYSRVEMLEKPVVAYIGAARAIAERTLYV